MISYLKYYAQLLKFRLSVTVVISALAGYLIGVTEFELTELALLIFGGFLVTGSANGFNQVLVGGTPVNHVGNADTCSTHTRSTGSGNVNINTSG